MNQLKNTEEIIQWLFEQKIYNFEILDDFRVNVTQDVEIRGKMSALPIYFNIVEGNFICSSLGLTTLEGCPDTVRGDFNCSQNKLTTLEYAPQIVNNFNCVFNQLKTLQGIAQVIDGDLYANNNQLKNLQYISKEIKGQCILSNNYINNLDDWPEYVKGEMGFLGNRFLEKEVQEMTDFKELSSFRLKMQLQKELEINNENKRRLKI